MTVCSDKILRIASRLSYYNPQYGAREFATEINFYYSCSLLRINLLLFTVDCFLNDNSLLSADFYLCLHLTVFLFFASQTSKTPKRK